MYSQQLIKNNGCAAFTLVEVIAVLILLGIVAVIPLSMYTNSVTSHVKADSNYAQIQNVQLAVTRITLELQNATNITFPTSSSGATGISYTYGTSRTIETYQESDGTGSIYLIVSPSTALHPLVKNLNFNTATNCSSTPTTTSLCYDSSKSILTAIIVSNFSDGSSRTFTTKIGIPN